MTKRTKANGDSNYRCTIVVKKTTRLYTENLQHSVKKCAELLVIHKEKKLKVMMLYKENFSIAVYGNSCIHQNLPLILTLSV